MTNEEMRIQSGAVSSSVPLDLFLYILARDYLTPGKIEEIMVNHVEIGAGKICGFTNGWLANYAMNVSERLLPSEAVLDGVLVTRERVESVMEIHDCFIDSSYRQAFLDELFPPKPAPEEQK